MATKQSLNSLYAPDGSLYVTETDGGGNLVSAGAPQLAAGSNVIGKVGIDQTTPGTTNAVNLLNTVYPYGAVPITASATGTTAATVATLAGTSGKTTYISGFTITADATAAIAGAATVAGTVTGSLNYIQSVGASTAASTLSQTFNPPIPASAANTAITVTSAAAGVGGATAVTAWGYQL